MNKYAENDLILWKILLCLSAFSLNETKMILLKYTPQNTFLGKETQKSLQSLQNRNEM